MKINIDESQNVEYKESWNDKYLQWICGFANAQGGRIFIGVNDNHEVVGLNDSKRLMEDIPNKIATNLGVVADVNLLHAEGLDYIEIVVEPYSVPINYKGHYHFRSGSTKQELTGVALQQFVLKKLGKSWDDITHDTATIDAIDRNAIDYFLKKGINAGRIDSYELNASTQEILENLDLIDENGKLKNAALLLFAKRPQRYFTCVEFQIGRFGKDEGDLLEQDIIEGNVIEMADKVMQVLKFKYLHSPIHFEGMQRIETLEIPDKAFREILYNAIAHKDYTGVMIQMHVYDDRIEIWNDGGLPDGYTPETLMGHHSSKPRNKNIAYAFFKAGFIDRWGLGYKKIREGFDNAQMKMPDIESVDGGVKVTVWRNLPKGNDDLSEIKTTVHQLGPNLPEHFKDLIINFINSEYSVKEMQLFTNCSPQSKQLFIKKYINPLMETGLIEQTHPDSPNHPRQKYRLTELGKELQKYLRDNSCEK